MNRKILLFVLILALTLALVGCGNTKAFEAGGLSIVVNENGELIKGKEGTWEVPGKYRLNIKGVYLDDTKEAIADLKDPAGVLIFRPKGHFYIVYEATNLGYDITEKDKELNNIQLSAIFSTFRLNDGKSQKGNIVNIRPYPFSKNDYKYDKVKLDYRLDLIEKGKTSEELVYEFVTDRSIDIDKDVLVFTTFFNDKENDKTYDGVFELKFKSLSKYINK